jgi:hypothetical protein
MLGFKTKHQKEQAVIQEIHDSFDNAQEVLLQEAKDFLASAESFHIPQEDIADRYAALGFNNIPIVKETATLKIQRDTLEHQKVTTKEQADMINHYKNTYPFLKFLTENKLDVICKKYNLVYAPVTNYIETVPEKNLIEIEKAQALKKDDEPKPVFLIKVTQWWNNCPQDIRKILSQEIKGFDRYDIKTTDEGLLALARKLGYKGDYTSYIFGLETANLIELKREGLFICAPQSHFNTKNLKRHKLGFFDSEVTEIKDPIVFRYVRGGCQCLSKWGLEANDSELILPINN